MSTDHDYVHTGGVDYYAYVSYGDNEYRPAFHVSGVGGMGEVPIAEYDAAFQAVVDALASVAELDVDAARRVVTSTDVPPTQ